MKVGQKSRMEAELSSLDSELERAKLAQAARARRHEVEGIKFEIEEKAEAHVDKESPSAKRALFPDEKTSRPDPQARPSEGTAKAKVQWTPQLDLGQCEEKVRLLPWAIRFSYCNVNYLPGLSRNDMILITGTSLGLSCAGLGVL